MGGLREQAAQLNSADSIIVDDDGAALLLDAIQRILAYGSSSSPIRSVHS